MNTKVENLKHPLTCYHAIPYTKVSLILTLDDELKASVMEILFTYALDLFSLFHVQSVMSLYSLLFLIIILLLLFFIQTN